MATIKGITVEIGGDTTKLGKALENVNKTSRACQTELKQVNTALKFNPRNVELLSQKQAILNERIAATKEKLRILKEAQAQVTAQFEKGEIDAGQYRQFQRELIQTESQLKTFSREAAETTNQLNAAGDKFDKLGTKSEAFTNKVKNASKVLAGAATAIGGTSIKMSMDYEKSFAKVSTLLDANETDFNKYSKDILQASTDSGAAVDDFSEAVYQSLSASVKAGDAIDFTSKAVKLAKAGFTETSTAVDVMTTAINAYSMSAKEANGISDKLITTQNLGKTTVNELAQYMGKVIPTAANANFSFTELSASLAKLTKNGINTRMSVTDMNSLIAELSKNGSIADKTLKELTGSGFADLKKEGKSTTDILQMLKDEANKSGKSLSDMFGNVQAGTAALTIMSDGGKDYNNILKQMENSSGTTDTALKKLGDTASVKLKKALNALKNDMIKLGQEALPVVASLAEKLQSLIGWVVNHKSAMVASLSAIAAGLTAFNVVATIQKLIAGFKAFKAAQEGATVAQYLLNAAMKANPLALIISLIVSVVAALAGFIASNKDAQEKIKETWGSIKTHIGGAVTGICHFFTKTIPNAAKSLVNFFKNNFKEIALFIANPFAGGFALAYKHSNTFRNKVQSVFKAIGNFFKTTVPKFISYVVNGFKELPHKLGYALGYTLATVTKWGAQTANYLKTNVPKWINNIITSFKQLPGKMWNCLIKAVEKVGQWNKEMTQKAKETASNFLNSVINTIKNLPGHVWNWLKNTINKVIDFKNNMKTHAAAAGQSFTNTLINGLKNLPSHMFNIGKNIVKGIWRGIKNAKDWLIDKVKSFASGIKDGIKDALDIRSPSRVMADEVGRYIAEGIGVGIEENQEKAFKPFTNIVDTISDTQGLQLEQNIKRNINNNIKNNPSAASNRLNNAKCEINLMLPNGQTLAYAVADLVDIIQGNKLALKGRGVIV